MFAHFLPYLLLAKNIYNLQRNRTCIRAQMNFSLKGLHASELAVNRENVVSLFSFQCFLQELGHAHKSLTWMS